MTCLPRAGETGGLWSESTPVNIDSTSNPLRSRGGPTSALPGADDAGVVPLPGIERLIDEMNHIPEERGEIREGVPRPLSPRVSAEGDGGALPPRSERRDAAPDPGPSAAAGEPDVCSSGPDDLLFPARSARRGTVPTVPESILPDGEGGQDGAPGDEIFVPPPGGAGDMTPRDSAGGGKKNEKPRSGILEALALVFVAFALALILKSYVAEAYEIKGRSMEPTFKTGQRVIVLKVGYEVQRSDVVVFASTEDANKDLIKRVVGLPGDWIEWRNGKVFVNGELLEEAYVEHPALPYEPAQEEKVPPGKFYVLGDNRPDSHDSRSFHSIPEGNLKGEVVLRWWPFEDFNFFGK